MLTIARLNSAPEVFVSLQGEGVRMGTPSVFLRLAGCNLRCSWCDTKYSWGNGAELEESAVAELIMQHGCHSLVITGGEPLMQQQGIMNLLRLLPQSMFVEIETNGTLTPVPELAARVDQWNVSPKLKHAGNHPTAALVPASLQYFAARPNAWFKFVVQQEQDWGDIATLNLPKQRIILMPCATTHDQLHEMAPRVADLCLRQGVRYGHRLHIALWNDAKGV